MVLQEAGSSLEAMHGMLDCFWQRLGGGGVALDDLWRAQFTTAVAEIGTNILRHAYDNLPVVSIGLRLRLYADCVEARLIDRGRPYTPRPPAVPEIPDDIAALAEGGFGLTIACAAVDVLRYRRTTSGVNCWRLRKKLPRLIAPEGCLR